MKSPQKLRFTYIGILLATQYLARIDCKNIFKANQIRAVLLSLGCREFFLKNKYN